MPLDFDSIDTTLLKTATEQALKNWQWWQDSFEHSGDFCSLPVLESYPQFRGFGADYSVFRGWNGDQCEAARLWFKGQINPNSFADLFGPFQAYCEGHELLSKNLQKRISLCSKLLGMWRPAEFAMWDTKARKGLKVLHGSQRGHCYTANTADNYETFCDDFFTLYQNSSDQIFEFKTMFPVGAKEVDFGPRILDNYLMDF